VPEGARSQLTTLIDKIKQEQARVDNIQANDPATKAHIDRIKSQLAQRRSLLEEDLKLRDEYYASSQKVPVTQLEKTDPEQAAAQATGDAKKEILHRIQLQRKIAALRKRHPALYARQKVSGEPDYERYACIQQCIDPGIRGIQEENIRKHIVSGMKELNTADCRGTNRFNYTHNSTDREYKMPRSYWVPNVPNSDFHKPDQSKNMDFHTKPGVRASDAVNAVFSGPECPIYIECLTAMYFLYFQAVLKTIGPDQFDRMFPNGIHVSPDSQDINGLIKAECKDSASDLKQGDWVYFYNNGNYLSRHPPTDFNNAFQGENAVVMSRNKYEGFGVDTSTEMQMKKELLDAYNTVPQKAQGSDWVPDTDTAQRFPPITQDKIPGLTAPRGGCQGKIGPVIVPNVSTLP
jgi:hypothetical protein